MLMDYNKSGDSGGISSTTVGHISAGLIQLQRDSSNFRVTPSNLMGCFNPDAITTIAITKI